MVVFDNSIFCLVLHPDAKPRTGVDRVPERIQNLMDTLKANKEMVIIPAPVLSEFLVFAGSSAPDYLLTIRENSALRIEPFDERAAIELADIEIAARKRGNKRGNATTAEWDKVKFDRQIVAIAKVHGASVIYSDDADVAAHGRDAGIRVLALADLPLPPTQQIPLPYNEEKRSEEQTGTEVESSPAPVPGSTAGSTAGEARAEAAEEKAGEGQA